MPFRRILFPVDYSPACEAIIPYVTAMAERFGAALKLIHVYGIVNVPYSVLMAGGCDKPEDLEHFEENRLREFAQRHFRGLHCETVVEQGDAATGIQKAVEQGGVDLVMMPTHGHGPVRKLLLGSTTAKILHDLRTPVWTASYAVLGLATPLLPVSSVLCALDDTEEEESILKAADLVARQWGASLSLIHVSEPPPGYPEIEATSYQDDLVEASRAGLDRLQNKLGTKAPLTVTSAPLLQAVCEQAVSIRAGLVVVGRGTSQEAFAKIFSSLYGIIREVPCPVLSV